MFFKRQLPVIIMMTIGILTLFANFIEVKSVSGWVKDDSLLWFGIIAAFAIILGAFNLLKIHFSKVFRNKEDYPYSIILITGFILMIFAGFFFHGVDRLGNGKWDQGENFEDIGDKTWSQAEEFEDVNDNGKWDSAEEFEDLNGNNKWDQGEVFTDIGNGRWNEGEKFEDHDWGDHLFGVKDTLFSRLFNSIIDPLESTMFALLAFFV